MVQAFEYEREAPPFGVYVHESARSFAPDERNEEPFNYVWWKWFQPVDRAIAVELREILDEYYEWATNNSRRIENDLERIDEHEKLAKQYFPKEPRPTDSERTPPVSEGDRETVSIEDMGDEGDGIAKVGDDDFVIFVEGANIGEEVRVHIEHVTDDYAVGTVGNEN
jgi:predicted RNA-binding protein with TRAM domain